MLRQTLTYKDFNGEEQTEDFYFNLTQAEALATELSGEGNSFSSYMDRVIKAKNGREIISGMQEIIKLSYGERSVDGSRFEKSPEILMRFTSSNAYSVLFMKMATDAGFAAEFANGITPEGLDEAVLEAARNKQAAAESTTAETPSQKARRESEERMQGHRNKMEAKGSDIVDVPKPQVIEGPSEVAPTEEPAQELRVTSTKMTPEEIDALPISEEAKARLHESLDD
jgi:hypothetical protein